MRSKVTHEENIFRQFWKNQDARLSRSNLAPTPSVEWFWWWWAVLRFFVNSKCLIELWTKRRSCKCQHFQVFRNARNHCNRVTSVPRTLLCSLHHSFEIDCEFLMQKNMTRGILVREAIDQCARSELVLWFESLDAWWMSVVYLYFETNPSCESRNSNALWKWSARQLQKIWQILLALD